MREIKHGLSATVLPLEERPSVYSRQSLPVSQLLGQIRSLNQMGYVSLNGHKPASGPSSGFSVHSGQVLLSSFHLVLKEEWLRLQASPSMRLTLGFDLGMKLSLSGEEPARATIAHRFCLWVPRTTVHQIR